MKSYLMSYMMFIDWTWWLQQNRTRGKYETQKYHQRYDYYTQKVANCVIKRKRSQQRIGGATNYIF